MKKTNSINTKVLKGNFVKNMKRITHKHPSSLDYFKMLPLALYNLWELRGINKRNRILNQRFVCFSNLVFLENSLIFLFHLRTQVEHCNFSISTLFQRLHETTNLSKSPTYIIEKNKITEKIATFLWFGEERRHSGVENETISATL